MTTVNNNQAKVLHLIKRQGQITAVQIAKHMQMTSMGARQHVEALEKQGFVEHKFCNEGRGRPKKYWLITQLGQSQFPNGHSDLIVNLLGHMKQRLGEKTVDDLIICRENDILQSYKQALDPLPNLTDKLKVLAELRTAEGYMASIEKIEDGWLLIESHCPICSAATQCQQFCRSEKMIFERVLKTKVERTEYLLDGDRRCCYRIS